MLLTKTYESNLGSLTDHVYEMKTKQGIELKKQSLHNRFTKESVSFLKSVINHKLKQNHSCSSTESDLEYFKHVFVQDATKFGLPEAFATSYPCYGGAGGKAGCQIQFVYELKHQKVCDLSIHAATRSESLSSVNNDWVKPGSLVLRDLGYFTMEGFRQIMEKEAFFISKAKAKTAFFDSDKNRFDLKKLVYRMKRNNLDIYEQDLIMGFEKKKKLPVRVVFSLVPEEVKNQRLRKAYKNARERNWTVTEEYKLWAGINAYITNVPSKIISGRDVPLIYKLRWQVELIFKTWKSNHKIHLYRSFRKERFECYLIAGLLLILLQNDLFTWLQNQFSNYKKTLSIQKFTKMMKHLKHFFDRAIINGKSQMKPLLTTLYSLEPSTLFKEKRKPNIAYEELLSLCI